MFFYIYHHLNQYLFSVKDVKDPNFNVRAIIMGGISYIFFHNYLNSIDSSYKQYFKWIVLLDIIAMMVIYNSYYSEGILQKLQSLLHPIDTKEDQQSVLSKHTNRIKDTASYFNASVDNTTVDSNRELEDIEEEDEEEDDESVQKLIDKMVGTKEKTI
jgi:hypothetical protein